MVIKQRTKRSKNKKTSIGDKNQRKGIAQIKTIKIEKNISMLFVTQHQVSIKHEHKSQAAQAHYVWVRASEVIWSEYTRIISVLSDAK